MPVVGMGSVLRRTLVRRAAYAGLASILLFALVSFRPITHQAAAEPLLADLEDDAVRVGDLQYAVDPVVGRAIREHPAAYRAGLVGPDAFPDVQFGMAIIHPDLKCRNGADEDRACAASPGTFAHEWLGYLYAKGWDYYRSHAGQAEGERALAFTYGVLAHAAGDMWSHTLINELAGGTYPLASERANPCGNPCAVARRHLLLEGYIGQASGAADRAIEVPTDFLYQAFVVDPGGRVMDQGSFIARMLGLKTALGRVRQRFADDMSWTCVGLSGTVGPEACPALRLYVGAWLRAIDTGLRAWPDASGRVALRLYQEDDVDGAAAALRDFARDHADMLTGPAGDVLGRFSPLLEPILAEVRSAIDMDLDPFRRFPTFILRGAFGFAPDELRPLIASRDLTLAGTLAVPRDTKDRLDGMMTLPGGGRSASVLAPYANTTTAAALSLLSPETLDSLLHVRHVGRLYTGAGLSVPGRAAMASNAMLGFIRSLDRDHQWLRAWDRERFGEGMPLWMDCLARRRAFRPLFVGTFPDSDGACELLSDPLPTVEVVSPQNHLTITRCFGVPIVSLLINHGGADIGLSGPQPFSWYASVTTRQDIAADGVNNAAIGAVGYRTGDVVFHRVVHGTIPELGSVPTRADFSTCRPGTYDVEVRTYQRMRSLEGRALAQAQSAQASGNCPTCARVAARPAMGGRDDRVRMTESRRNMWIPARPPFLTAPVDSIQRFVIVIREPGSCPLSVAVAAAAECPATGTAGGTVNVLDAPAVLCVTLPTGQARCDPALGFPALDADADSVPDAADNCPVDPNRDQADEDRNGTGDACELLRLRRPEAATFVRVGDPNPRVVAAMDRLQALLGTDIGPGTRPCPMCPGPTPDPAVAALRRETNQLLIGAITPDEFAQRLRPLLVGVQARVSTGSVGRPVVVTDRLRHVRVDVHADGPGVLALEIPAGTFGEPAGQVQALRVTADGRVVPARISADPRRAVITLAVDATTRVVEVTPPPP